MSGPALAVVVGWAPGLPHIWEQGEVGGAAALLDAMDAGFAALPMRETRVEAGSWIGVSEDVGAAVLAAARFAASVTVDGRSVASAAVAVGRPDPARAHHRLGALAWRARSLVRGARVGEVHLLAEVLRGVELPAGVGTFPAPEAVSKAAGAPVVVLRDYR